VGGTNRQAPVGVSCTTTEHFGQAIGAMSGPIRTSVLGRTNRHQEQAATMMISSVVLSYLVFLMSALIP
jgi:hypothetical protein